jgi:hypothetical protein
VAEGDEAVATAAGGGAVGNGVALVEGAEGGEGGGQCGGGGAGAETVDEEAAVRGIGGCRGGDAGEQGGVSETGLGQEVKELLPSRSPSMVSSSWHSSAADGCRFVAEPSSPSSSSTSSPALSGSVCSADRSPLVARRRRFRFRPMRAGRREIWGVYGRGAASAGGNKGCASVRLLAEKTNKSSNAAHVLGHIIIHYGP